MPGVPKPAPYFSPTPHMQSLSLTLDEGGKHFDPKQPADFDLLKQRLVDSVIASPKVYKRLGGISSYESIRPVHSSSGFVPHLPVPHSRTDDVDDRRQIQDASVSAQSKPHHIGKTNGGCHKKKDSGRKARWLPSDALPSGYKEGGP
jgi:hypothetical protein